jgi:uncharacterized OB-fold protein
VSQRCPVCGAFIGPMQRLCSTCNNGQLERYVNENPAGVTAYAAAGMREIDHLLERHAEFHCFLLEKGIT